jgi:hypothetical protein
MKNDNDTGMNDAQSIRKFIMKIFAFGGIGFLGILAMTHSRGCTPKTSNQAICFCISSDESDKHDHKSKIKLVSTKKQSCKRS